MAIFAHPELIPVDEPSSVTKALVHHGTKLRNYDPVGQVCEWN